MRLLLVLLVAGTLAACQNSPSRTAPGSGATPPARDIKTTQERALAAYAAGEWAEPHFVALARAMPQDAELWFRLGNVYARNDKPELAVAAYREALVRQPDLGKAWFNMGVIQLLQAAASFHQMEVHVAPGDPSRRQAEEAYAGILAILETDGSAAPEQAVPEQAVPEQAVPEQAVPEQAVPEQAVPEQAEEALSTADDISASGGAPAVGAGGATPGASVENDDE
jgi:Flp pilus assembly protein TadD